MKDFIRELFNIIVPIFGITFMLVLITVFISTIIDFLKSKE